MNKVTKNVPDVRKLNDERSRATRRLAVVQVEIDRLRVLLTEVFTNESKIVPRADDISYQCTEVEQAVASLSRACGVVIAACGVEP